MATDRRAMVVDIVRQRGYLRLEKPVRLRSGAWSQDFVDGKAALAEGPDLRTACEELLGLAERMGLDFDAVGGPSMGADHLAHGMALVASKKWFAIRKEPKGRGTNKMVEGALLGDGLRVLLVEDVATTGASLLGAYEQIRGTGAEIVGALTLVDRGYQTRRGFETLGVPYDALVTHADLGIEPLGD